MAAARDSKSALKEGDNLVSYRLTQVELAVKEVSQKFDEQDNIKKSDLIEFRNTILERFKEKNDELQLQINTKANASDLKDVMTLIKAVGSIFGAIITGLVIYYLTHGNG